MSAQPTDDQQDSIYSDERPLEMQSLCMACHEQGDMRILLIDVPYFRQLVLSAFSCPHCGHSDRLVQSAGEIAPRGKRWSVVVKNATDLNRQVVLSPSASYRVEELDFECPSSGQGRLSTIEGLLRRALDALEAQLSSHTDDTLPTLQPLLLFLSRLRSLLDGSAFPFTFSLDDPAGNSFIENPHAPAVDGQLSETEYDRTDEQTEALGIAPAEQTDENNEIIREEKTAEEKAQEDDDELGIIVMQTHCSNCGALGDLRMHVADIPHFKDAVIMGFHCERCGYKTNEVKATGAVSELGRRYVVKVNSSEDLSRDILKSETAGLTIPEVDLELVPGTLGGRFTTIEGMLQQVKEHLRDSSFMTGDSFNPRADDNESQRKEYFDNFLDRLQALIELRHPFTVILDDPMGNSYVQNICAPDPDPSLIVEEYKRTKEQDEELGLDMIHTEDTNAENAEQTNE